MDEKKHLDFLGAVGLTLFSLAVIAGSLMMHKESGEVFYLSPGLMPLALGAALLVCSLIYLAGTLRDGGFSARTAQAGAWWKEFVRSGTVRRTAVGLVIMAIYVFVLLSFLPFWLSSLIFVIVLMLYLKASSPVKILLISAGTVAAIVVLFQVLFRVPLP